MVNKYCKRCHDINDTPQFQTCSKCRKHTSSISLRCYYKHQSERIKQVKEYERQYPDKAKKWRKKSYQNFKTNHPDRIKEIQKNSYEKNKKK